MDILTVVTALILPAIYLTRRDISPVFKGIVWLYYGLILIALLLLRP